MASDTALRTEFLDLLVRDAEFREEVRRQLLSDALIELPERFAAFVGRVDEFIVEQQTFNARVAERLDGVDHRLDRMDARFDAVDARLDRMDRRQDKMWGEIGNQRGEVFERTTINVLMRWLDQYCWERKRPMPEFEILWSDRNTAPHAERTWRQCARDLGIPAWNPALRQCDILLRATWPQQPSSPLRTVLLITGEVSTQLNQRRQEKVVRQYEALSKAGHAVLPVLVGLRHRTFVSMPNLMDVHLTEEELTDLRELSPPDDLYTLLDRLLERPAAQIDLP